MNAPPTIDPLAIHTSRSFATSRLVAGSFDGSLSGIPGRAWWIHRGLFGHRKPLPIGTRKLIHEPVSTGPSISGPINPAPPAPPQSTPTSTKPPDFASQLLALAGGGSQSTEGVGSAAGTAPAYNFVSSGGGTSPIVYLLLVLAAGLGMVWWLHRKKSHGKPPALARESGETLPNGAAGA